MSTTHINPHNRASLLSGLRTGGVRSSSAPHSAAPTGSFNIVPFPQALPTHTFQEEDEGDQIYEMPQRHVYNNRNIPTTAAVDGPNNRFASQQAAPRGMNPLSMPFNLMSTPQMQLQMMQLEMMRLQTLQAQQLQAEMLAQQIQQQQQQQQQAAIQARERRTSLGFNPPATAGPLANSFNSNGSMRRPSQADFLRAQLGVGTPSADHVPMTAAIGGRFGSRSTSLNVHPSTQIDQPGTPNPATTIISGGTPLGSASANVQAAAAVTPSKSDAASSWRRGGNNNSVLTPNRAVSSVSRIGQRSSPPPALETTHLGVKFRPQPLRFNAAVSQPLPTVTIDTTDDETDDTQSCGSSVKSITSKSSPTTPRSTSSHEMPLSPREEASKKLFEGLGISRPVSATPSDQGQNQQNQQAPAIPIISTTPAPGHRLVSQPTRQPRGPPSGADELGPKNFATRIRRRAIGGLGMLLGARDRREAVEAF
jgi:hypothetical protein